ncbi:MAG: hypothetical protein ACK4EY_02930 [Flavipsychrobacter sp.]
MKYITLFILCLSSYTSFSKDGDFSLHNTFAKQTISKETAPSFAPLPPPDRYRHNSGPGALGITAQILGGIGGGLIGWPVGTYIGGGDPEWTLAAIGGGLVAIAVPLALIDDHRNKGGGYRAHNAGPKGQYDICLVSNKNGIGIALKL